MAAKTDKNGDPETPRKEPPGTERPDIKEPDEPDKVPEEKLVHPDDGTAPHPPRMKAATSPPEQPETGQA
jgi:hypothetical protein